MTVIPDSTIIFVFIKHFIEFFFANVVDVLFLVFIFSFLYEKQHLLFLAVGYFSDMLFYICTELLHRVFIFVEIMFVFVAVKWSAWIMISHMVYVYLLLVWAILLDCTTWGYFFKQTFHIHIDVHKWNLQRDTILGKLKYLVVCLNHYCFTELVVFTYIFMWFMPALCSE